MATGAKELRLEPDVVEDKAIQIMLKYILHENSRPPFYANILKVTYFIWKEQPCYIC